MSKLLWWIVLGLAVGIVVAVLVAPSNAKVRDPGRYARTSDGNGWNVKDERQAVRVIVSKWHVPGGVRKASQVITCESGWRARESNSCCHGLLQLHESYFGGWFRRFNPHRGWKLRHAIENARTNLVIGLRLAHAQGWSAWDCA